jgi:branched-chain amino acid transport system ATP-binding protein
MSAELRVEGLVRAFYGVRAVDDISFVVRQGSITGLIGPNGSGKSTTIDCLTGFQRIDAGRWFLGNRELTGAAPHRIARAGLARTFQDVRVYDTMSLLENVCLAGQEHARISWAAAIFQARKARQADAAAAARARVLLEDVGLARYADAPAGILSYGQKKLLALAGALMAEPKLVLLDEPVAGVNPTMVLQVEDAIRRLNARGVTLLIVEHNVDFIMRLCERVVVLDAGRLLAEGEPSIIRDDPRVLEAYIGGEITEEAPV